MLVTHMLVRVEAPHFVAGLEVRNGKVAHAAPIIGYMLGWKWVNASQYLQRKGWKWTTTGHDE